MCRLLSPLLPALLPADCASPATPGEEGAKWYGATFLTPFDTVTTVVGYVESEKDFQTTVRSLHDMLLEYHQLYDIYSDYDGMVNLKAVNSAVDGAPVVVNRKIVDLFLFYQDLCEDTGSQVNATLGDTLALWHDTQETGTSDPASAALPDATVLAEAARRTDFFPATIDKAVSTVQTISPASRLDVGAIAKGYAVEQVCRVAPDGLLLSAGGNVRVIGPKPGGENWVVGIQTSGGESETFLHTLHIRDVSVVTDDDYQRYYTMGGVCHYHVIDPVTCHPITYWRAVTALCVDSSLADALPIILFTFPQAEGQVLLGRYGVEVTQVDVPGGEVFSPGFSTYLHT